MRSYDDYRYSKKAQKANLMLIWECDKCDHERKDYPGINEGGRCSCGGTYQFAGEEYDSIRR